MSRYFWAAMCCAGIVALNFGVIGCCLGPSKMFAMRDMEVYSGEQLPEGKKYKFVDSLLSGSVFLGCALGSALISILSKYGRHKCMIIINLLSVIGCFGASVGQHWSLFMISRLLSGISVGMSGVAAMYLSEICPRSKRGMFGALYSVFVTFGEMAIIMFQLSHGKNLDDSGKCKCHFKKDVDIKDKVLWRISQMAGGIFSLIGLYLLVTTVKEDSPFILAKNGQLEEARHVLEMLQGKEHVEQSYNELMEDLASQSASGAKKASIIDAFKHPDSRYALFVVFGIAILRQMCGIYVFTLSASELFGQIVGEGLKASAWGVLCPVVNFLVCCTMPFYVEKLGRRTLLIIGSGSGFVIMAIALIMYATHNNENNKNKKCKCCCCCCCSCSPTSGGVCDSCTTSGHDGKCCCASCKTSSSKCSGGCNCSSGTGCSTSDTECSLLKNVEGKSADWRQYVMIVACILFVGCFATGYGGVSWLYFGEALPPEYKDSAYSVASILNWLTCAIVVSTAAPMQNALGDKVYWFYVICSGIGCVFAILFVKETAGVPLGQAYKGATCPEIITKIASLFTKTKPVIHEAAKTGMKNIRA
uniref:Hexose transporter 1 n=1 Tax=Babesia bovis TaxID=5865 RepID=B0LKY9_BABBO|nr:putative hexose transporter 2 [Babesia bovis]